MDLAELYVNLNVILMMKIFVSWGGGKSKKVALALQEWIPDLIQNVELWVSDKNIHAGSRWNDELNNALQKSYIGIICLTSENLEEPWILFEAGSLSKSLTSSKVIPYRLDITATDIRPPLSQFQGVDADKKGTFKLLMSINELLEKKINPQRLERLFDKLWEDLESKLTDIKKINPQNPVSKREAEDYLEEILSLVRNLQPKSNNLESFINSFNYKANEINAQLMPYLDQDFVIDFLKKFNKLHQEHLTYLKQGNLELSKRTILQIYELISNIPPGGDTIRNYLSDQLY